MSLLSLRRRVRLTAIVAAVSLLALPAMSGCASESREQVKVAADYVRCSVRADYEGMSKVVSAAARPYCYAMASAPQPDPPLAEIVDEKWEKGSLVIEISWGPASSFLRLSPPKGDESNEVVVETWNDAGARSDGTLTVAREQDRLVVTHIDGEPIEEVLTVGSGGL
ncbi:MAG: hypothetical protein EG823_08620 [Actinobacteria bacterium]|nr:hypothetical protein [Actinomycetota bacterium]